MSKLTEEFESVRYADHSLSNEENLKRKAKREQLLREATDEEFQTIIENTGIVQAKIAYRQIKEA